MTEFHPRRPAVVALTRSRRHLHLAQQGIHLGHGQDLPRAHRTVTGNRRRYMIELVAKAHGAAQLGDLPGKIRKQSCRIGVSEGGWDGSYQHCRRTKALKLETHGGKLGSSGLKPITIRLVEFDDFGHQERLPCDRTGRTGRSHALEHQPLVSRMLIDDDQAVFGLGHDIGCGHLTARDTQGVTWNELDRRLGATGRRVREKLGGLRDDIC